MNDSTLMIKSLIKKHLDGSATEQEKAAFIQLWNLYDDEELAQLIEEVNAEIPLPPAENLPKVDASALAHKIVTIAASRKLAQRKKTLVKYTVSIAASILLIAGIWLNKVLSEKQQYKIVCDPSIASGEINTAGFNCTIKDGEKSYVADSSTKLVLQYDNLQVIQQPGRIIYHQLKATNDTAHFREHEISTAPEQQYLIVLPGNTILRLNAQTKLQIAEDSLTGTLKTTLVQGEIFVETQGEFTLASSNVNITSMGGRFDVRTIVGGSLVAVSDGSLNARLSESSQVVLNALDWSALLKIKDKEIIKDTIITERCANIEGIAMWKNTERIYDDIPLEAFVMEMQSWYGIQFENLKCLDKKKRITTRLCYKASREDFFAVLRHNGAVVRQNLNGGYTFCKPEINPTSRQMAVVKKRTKKVR